MSCGFGVAGVVETTSISVISRPEGAIDSPGRMGERWLPLGGDKILSIAGSTSSAWNRPTTTTPRSIQKNVVKIEEPPKASNNTEKF